jgi:hypothetical protein
MVRHLSLRSIALGFAVSVALDIAVALLLFAAFGGGRFAADMDEAQWDQAFASLAQEPTFLLLSLALGLVTTVIGGHVAARTAGRLPYMHAAAVGLIGLLLGLFMWDSAYPLWWNLSAHAALLPSALWGGHLAKHGIGSVR